MLCFSVSSLRPFHWFVSVLFVSSDACGSHVATVRLMFLISMCSTHVTSYFVAFFFFSIILSPFITRSSFFLFPSVFLHVAAFMLGGYFFFILQSSSYILPYI